MWIILLINISVITGTYANIQLVFHRFLKMVVK